MIPKKKLQVFISSTYDDLLIERQVAVQAILNAGHIPAGMELFTAGDRSQLEVIYDWIKESDVYMLILGGRYGSIDESTMKSYIHLEYEYALKISKPLFAVVISENALDIKVKKHGKNILELEHQSEFKEFKNLVLSKVVRFWDDTKDIKLAIHETLREYERRSDLIGWIPGNSSSSISEFNQLQEENLMLQKRLSKFEKGDFSDNKLRFDQTEQNLISHIIDISEFNESQRNDLQRIANAFGDPSFNLLHFLWLIKDRVFEEDTVDKHSNDLYVKKSREGMIYLRDYGLMDLIVYSNIEDRTRFTDFGSAFIRYFANKNSSKLVDISKAIQEYLERE